MQAWSLLLVAIVGLTSCKLQRASSSQDKFGRAVGKISKELTGQVDAAIKKFVQNDDTDDIIKLVKKGGKASNEAIAAFKLVVKQKETAVSSSLRALEDNAKAIRAMQAKSVLKDSFDYDKLLKPFFDDASKALDDLLEMSNKYYRALPKIADSDPIVSDVLAKQLYVSMNTDYWLKTSLPRLADIKSTAALAKQARNIETVARQTYAAAMKRVYNLPIENYFLARWWVGKSKAARVTDNKQMMKIFEDMMAHNPQKADEFFASFTKGNIDDIEEIIYQKISAASNVNKVSYFLDEIVYELDEMMLNSGARGTAMSAVLSKKSRDAIYEANKGYWIKISEAGKRAGNTREELLRGRIFGLWGDDMYEKVAKWEKIHGKALNEDVEVRDILYRWQEECAFAGC